MIAFPALVVVADEALSGKTVEQPILEAVYGRRNRRRHLPDDDFLDRAVIEDHFVGNDENGSHAERMLEGHYGVKRHNGTV